MPLCLLSKLNNFLWSSLVQIQSCYQHAHETYNFIFVAVDEFKNWILPVPTMIDSYNTIGCSHCLASAPTCCKNLERLSECLVYGALPSIPGVTGSTSLVSVQPWWHEAELKLLQMLSIQMHAELSLISMFLWAISQFQLVPAVYVPVYLGLQMEL